MALELTFFGGVNDEEKGELGGVQCLIKDTNLDTKIMLEIGQRPDKNNEYFGFPFRPKSFEALPVSEFLHLFPEMEGLYRPDYEHLRRKSLPPSPVDGILVTHGHYDHIGGLPLVHPDIPVHMSLPTLQILWLWQYTSGRTVNQFVDTYDSFSLKTNLKGKPSTLDEDEAIQHRNIQLFESDNRFKIKNIEILPCPVDHSLLGAFGFILYTSSGKLLISGDNRLRGRRREDTERLIQTALDEKVDYVLWEGSLLHKEHEGTEEDLAGKVSELIANKSLVITTFPPRDFDRLASLYEAAKDQKRMLVITPAQALALMLFDGDHALPRINWKYIGVFLPRKKKGFLDKDYPEELIKEDYYYWERQILSFQKWKGHEGKPQRVSLEDIRDNQDQFLFNLSLYQMIGMLNETHPAKGSFFFRSVPEPYTEDMAIQEVRLINILKAFGMLNPEPKDHLNPSLKVNVDQVHVTGHFNRREFREILAPFQHIIPYHNMSPRYYIEDHAGHARITIPLRGEKLIL
jgi:ribonuclease J